MSSDGISAAAARRQAVADTFVASKPPQPGFWLSVATLWLREFRGFYRQKARVAAGLATPLIFWIALGSGFGSSLRANASGGYLEFFFPGAVTLVVLFASIFSNISIIEDRREGFLLSVLVAPVPRGAMVLGKILGATTIGAVQGAIFLPLIPLLDIPIDWAQIPLMGLMVLLMAFGLTSLGFFFAWWLNSVQGFHAVMNVVLMPMWLLSGALFPPEGASQWMGWLMSVNPLTYGVTGLRRLLFAGQAVSGPSMEMCWGVTAGFGAAALTLAIMRASRPSPKDLS